MTRTLRLGMHTKVLLVVVLVGTFAVVLMDGRTGFATPRASAAQNTNKNGGQPGNKKAPVKPKTTCSTADDSALATAIRERFAKHPLLKDEKEINVDVKARVATLTGQVKLKSHKRVAGAEAKKVACVKRVSTLICTKCTSPDIYCCQGVCQSNPCPPK